MNRDNRLFSGETRRPKALGRIPAPPNSWDNHAVEDSSADIAAIAHAEGWLTPPAAINRITLRPWQQTVFWGLRIYIGIMLVIMGWGFFHVAGG